MMNICSEYFLAVVAVLHAFYYDFYLNIAFIEVLVLAVAWRTLVEAATSS